MINCQQIHQDIANFRAQFEQIQQILKYVEQTAKKPANLTDSLEQIQATSDELLTTYLADFYDAYPKLKQYIGGKYSEKIKGFEDHVSRTYQLSDRHILVAGIGSETHILTIDDNGQASYGEEIKGFDDHISSMCQLSDRHILVAGIGSETHILTIDDNGQASYGDEIKGFDGYIHHIHQLPDQRLVVISHSGETRILNLNRPEPSLDHLKQNLDKLVA